MLRLYPSNKLEHLVDLLCAVVQHSENTLTDPLQAALRPTTIIVESLGMQHWLNMSLAHRHGVAMNLEFPMPTRFMWQIARQVLGDELIPQQSSYKREVLVWRLFELIQLADVIEHQDMLPIRDYINRLSAKSSEGVDADLFEFCRALADVYEQYMLYRPDWLKAWEQGLLMPDGEKIEGECVWQGYLWRLLVEQERYHPANLHDMAVQALRTGTALKNAQLPDHLFVFSLNTMAPQLVSFFDALASHIDIHVFHLNPCVNYWGDIRTSRQQAREQQLAKWLETESPNPMLADMGQQGRDLFNLLQQQQSFEISAFEAPHSQSEQNTQAPLNSLLLDIQQSIFEGKRISEKSQMYAQDESVVLVSAHSPLRELQGLHDHLLSLLEDDPTLHPQDILVMCPAIEDYAAFIPSVFATQKSAHQDQRIPCSVADRAPLDSVPEIAAFMRLLELPDSRFEVSAIVAFLRLEAIQGHFDIHPNELELLINWIEQTHIHWGINNTHQQHIVTQNHSEPSAQAVGLYSWEWGLKRLLTGLAHVDTAVFVDPVMTVPDVEGQNALALGKLCLLLEQLQEHRRALLTPRKVSDWQQYLHRLKNSFFGVMKESAQAALKIDKAIAELHEHVAHADYDQVINIDVLRLAFNQRFSSPDALNQFMTGQVTFCSMLPMRSIPFKVIAMLGMNDGQFPRQSTPISFDLMAKYPRRLGDRSRRGDDRYLFLEALISARQQLYISFQGNHVRDNSERQPSLVLREFLDYVDNAFAVSTKEKSYRSFQMPLHAFSSGHYDSRAVQVIDSFDHGWLRLAELVCNSDQEVAQENRLHSSTEAEARDFPSSISVSALVKAFRDPLCYFANHNLGLYLEDYEAQLSDHESFQISGLARFKLLSEYIDLGISEPTLTSEEGGFAELIRRHTLSGDLPADQVTQLQLLLLKPKLDALLTRFQALQPSQLSVQAVIEGITLHTPVYKSDQATDSATIIAWRPSKLRSEYHVLHRVQQLVTAMSFGEDVSMQVLALDSKSDPVKLQAYHYPAVSPSQAEMSLAQIIQCWKRILQQPQLSHIEFGDAIVTAYAKGEPDSDVLSRQLYKRVNQEPYGLCQNPYYQWFYPSGDVPNQAHIEYLVNVYQALLVQPKPTTIKD